MKKHKQKISNNLRLCLAMGLVATAALHSSCDAQGVIGKTKAESKNLTRAGADKEISEDLRFTVEQLISSLRNGIKRPSSLSIEKANDLFALRLKDVNITGYPRKVSHKVVHVTVSGTGVEFNTCVERVIRLASADNKTAARDIVTRFTTNLHDQVNPNVYFEQDGARYYFHKFSGIPTFHCTNAKADDRAILKAQPG